MNPEVKDLRLGVVDESRTAESRALVSAFVESRSFIVAGQYASGADLGRALSAGELDAGLIVPHDFARTRARGQASEVQIIVDSVNSNTAGIAAGLRRARHRRAQPEARGDGGRAPFRADERRGRGGGARRGALQPGPA